MLQIRIRVELGTLPKQPVWLKLIYRLCGVQMSVSNQQVVLLQAPPHFWLLHLPQEGPKVMRITCIRSEAELRGQRRLSQWTWHTAVSLLIRVGPLMDLGSIDPAGQLGWWEMEHTICGTKFLIFPPGLPPSTHCSFSSHNNNGISITADPWATWELGVLTLCATENLSTTL